MLVWLLVDLLFVVFVFVVGSVGLMLYYYVCWWYLVVGCWCLIVCLVVSVVGVGFVFCLVWFSVISVFISCCVW